MSTRICLYIALLAGQPHFARPHCSPHMCSDPSNVIPNISSSLFTPDQQLSVVALSSGNLMFPVADDLLSRMLLHGQHK